ncbi:MAG: response regulator [Cyclobacteriaceae bacterium]|nr:response regulator [Cyclobacteriaceae bacterium]
MSKKILIADDSSVIQTLTKKILITLNYDTIGTKSGSKVMDLVNNNNFDIILMDINLPGVDGMELTKQIRALSDSKKSSTPIIAISGNYHNYSIEDFKEAGINDHLIKPLNYDALVNAVKKYTE